jgi:RNA polymerase sigma-70 factor (ECF subfamily)
MTGDDRNDVQRAKAGDREALDRILKRHAHRLDALASKELGPALRERVRTSDLLQSTYLDVVKGIGSLKGDSEEAFVKWVAQVIRNNAKDKVRFFTATRRAEQDEPRPPSPGTMTASSQAVIAEDLLLVHRALDGLEPDHRLVIDLKVLQGLEHREVAAAMGRSESAVRCLLARARAALLVAIEDIQSGKI